MLNCAIIMGRLTADPELKTTQSNLSVVSFSVAVERNYQSQGERVTDFINCVAWRQNAEFISRYFRKGQMIAVQGSIQTRSYEDRTGAKRTAVEVVVDRASFCGSKAETGGQTSGDRYNAPAAQPTSYQNGSAEDFSDIADVEDDLPF
ncbi:MAG: single-stranded DNA-binding protein [Clostridiales bacterium]|nr:single-stranded DNA-binding protein [Clostridiales bacterium]MCD7827419.1 single-stranded DNA-binding protein [Clostridiales bacterium]